MELRRRLLFAVLALVIVVFIAATGYRVLGIDVTWLDAVYMTVVTLTSVGYGEIVSTSHSPALRIFNILVLVFGIGLMLYVFSVGTAFVVEGELKHLFWRRKMLKRIGELQGHILVCGAGETGLAVVHELVRTGRQVVVIEDDQQRLDRIRNMPGICLVEGDATDDEVLEQAGLSRSAGVVTSLPSDKDNLVVIVTIRQKHPTLRIVSRSIEQRMADKILRAGANSVVSPNQIGGMRLASEMVRPHVVTFLDLMLKEQSRTLRIEEIQVPYHSNWVGRTLEQLNLRDSFNLCCLAIKHPAEESYTYNPPEAEYVKGNSVMVVMGDVSDVGDARRAAEASRAMGR